MVPLNLNNLDEGELLNLEVGLERHNDKVVAHKWSLFNPNHVNYIHRMFKHMQKEHPTVRS